jgi:hypothetical protein
MSLRIWSGPAVVYLFFVVSAVLLAQPTNLPADIDWLTQAQSQDTFSKAGLTQADQQQILKQVEITSFDVPNSWLSELRVARISLGTSAGLVVRGSQLLCGGTGNCQTWVFRRENSSWLNMFDGEAPVVSRAGLVRQNAGVRDLVTTAHLSAEREQWTQYRFDGHLYRRTECYRVDSGATSRRAERVACP